MAGGVISAIRGNAAKSHCSELISFSEIGLMVTGANGMILAELFPTDNDENRRINRPDSVNILNWLRRLDIVVITSCDHASYSGYYNTKQRLN